MATPAQEDRRHDRRQRVLKGASILQDINTSEVSCTVRNMHEHGAELLIPVGVQIPPEFLLYVPVDAVAYKTVVTWRLANRVGVKFVGTAPKPAWHYG